MNVAVNVKTAEERLQFGVNKCKTMIVGKNYEEEIDNPIMVDKWKLEYHENYDNNEANRKIKQENNDERSETYDGEVEMEKIGWDDKQKQ